MTVVVNKGTFAKSTGGAPVAQTIDTGSGEDIKFLKLFGVKASAVGFASQDVSSSQGFSDGTTEKSVGYFSDNITLNKSITSSCSGDKILCFVDGTETITAEADVTFGTGIDAGKFTVTWTTNDSDADIIHFEAYTGSDITDVKVGEFTSNTATGNQAVTGVGFQGEYLSLMTASNVATTMTQIHARSGYGQAISSSARNTWGFMFRDNQNANKDSDVQLTDACLATLEVGGMDSGQIDGEWDFVSFDADGFTLNVVNAPDLADKIFYAVLNGGEYDVGSFNQPTSTGTDTVTVGFKPKGISLSSWNKVADTVPAQDTSPIKGSYGSGTSSAEGGIWWEHDNKGEGAEQDEDINTYTDKVIKLASGPSTIDAEADFDSTTSTAFVLDWTTADATAREILYFAIGIPVVTVDEDFTVDAILKGTQTFNFTVDALLQGVITKFFLIDAFIQDTFDKDFLVDARLSALAEFEIDSIVVLRNIEEFTIDAILVRSEEFLVDAFLQAQQTKTFAIDTFSQEEKTETFLVDALIGIPAVTVRQGTLIKDTGGAPVSQTIDTGTDVEIKFIKLSSTRQTSEGFEGIDLTISEGFSDGTNSRAISLMSEDGVGTTNTASRYANKGLTFIDSASSTIAECDVSFGTGVDAGKFTLTWTTNDAVASIIHFVTYGDGKETFIANVGTFTSNTVTGNQSITGVGFQGRMSLFLTNNNSAVAPSTVNEGGMCFGHASSPSKKNTVTFLGSDGQDMNNRNNISQRTDLALRTLAPSGMSVGNVDADYDFVSFDADGFTLNVIDAPATAIKIFYAVLKGGNYDVGDFNQPISNGTQEITTGFEPIHTCFRSWNEVADIAIKKRVAIMTYTSSGADEENGIEEGGLWLESDTGSLPVVNDVNTYTDRAILLASGASTIDAEANYQSSNDESFTLNWTDTDATAREILYWTVGEAPTEEFTVDARLAVRELFTVDAFLQATFDKDFTVDAVIVRNKLFDVDARLAIREFFDVDARLSALAEFTIDARLSALAEFTIDSRLSVRELFEVDARLVRSEEFDVDARLSALVEFTVDSRLSALAEFTVDASIVRNALFDIDAVIVRNAFFDVDAVVVDRFDEDFLIDAFLQATQIFNFTLDGFIEQTPEKFFILDAFIQDTFDEDFTIDSRLAVRELFTVDARLVRSEEFEVDARLSALAEFNIDSRLSALAEFEVDARLSALAEFDIDAVIVRNKFFDIDAVIVRNKFFDIDARLSALAEFEVDARLAVRELFDVDAVIVRNALFDVDARLSALAEFTVDSRLSALEEFDIDAVIVENRFFTVDARLIKTQTETFDVDSVLVDITVSEEFFVDAILTKTNIKEFTVDTFSLARQEVEFLIDGHVFILPVKNFIVNAIVQKEQIKEFTIQANIRFVNDVTYDLSAIIKKLGDNCSFASILLDDINSDAGWTKVTGGGATTVFIDQSPNNGVIFYDDFGGGNNAMRYFKDLDFNGGKGLVSSKDDIRVDFKYNLDTVVQGNTQTGSFGPMLVGLMEPTTTFVGESKRFGVRMRQVKSLSQRELGLEMTDTSGNIYPAVFETDRIITALDTDFFVTAEKVGQMMRLNVYTDELRTIHTAGSPTAWVDVSTLDEVTYGRVGGSAKSTKTPGGWNPLIDGFIDSINVLGDTCCNFLSDALAQAIQTAPFLVDASIVPVKRFACDALLQRLGDNCRLGTIFNDTFESASGWTVAFSNEWKIDQFPNFKQVELDIAGNHLTGRINKDLDQGQGGVVSVNSKDNIRVDFKYRNEGLTNFGGSGSIGGILMGVCETNSQIDLVKRFAVRAKRVSGFNLTIVGEMSDTGATGTGTQTSNIDIPLSTDVFVTLEKVGQNMTLNVFSDELRTTHIAGSPSSSVDVSSLAQVTYASVGGSAKRSNIPGGFNFGIDGFLDDVNVQTDVCVDFSVDGNLLDIPGEQFLVDAVIVRVKKFTLSAFIKALGDVRCQPTFAENIFEDFFTTTDGWSVEINSTGGAPWSTQRIFIDGETVSANGTDEFGDPEGRIRVSGIVGGGFDIGSPQPFFKTKYRRKRIDFNGGVPRINGPLVKVNFDLTDQFHPGPFHPVRWLSLNRSGAHPDNTVESELVLTGPSVTTTGYVLFIRDRNNNVASINVPVVVENIDDAFFTLEVDKNTNLMTLNVYTDQARTTHFSASPATVDISSIDTNTLDWEWLISPANSKGSGESRIASGAVDNVQIFSNPCALFQIDAFPQIIPIREFTVDARIVREIKFGIDAQLRGRKDFRIDAELIKVAVFDIDASLIAQPQVEFIVDAEFLETFNFATLFDAILIRASVFTVNAIFKTEPSDPDFSESHLLDITHLFSGIEEFEFTVDLNIATPSFFSIDAIIQPTIFTSVDAVLTTVSQPLLFSTVHIQDIVPLFGIAQPEEEAEVDGLIQEQDIDKPFFINARLIFQPSETPFVDSILFSITQDKVYDINSLLKATLGETPFVDSRVVSRNIKESIMDAFLFRDTRLEPTVNGLIIAEGQIEQFFIDAQLAIINDATFKVDAVIKCLGDNGICNFHPGTNTFGTGFEQFVGPIIPVHESNVPLLIGQEFNLTNQQVRSMTVLMRSTNFPNEITTPSILSGKIWSNVVKGNSSGEVVISTSENIIDADISSGDLPAGVWVQKTFTFDRFTTPFITGTFVVGFEHSVGASVADPQGVGVARPVISGSNVIPGEALFRRGSETILFTDVWSELLLTSQDMVIDIELVNGDEVIDGRSRQCPVMDALVIDRFDEEFIVDAKVVNRKEETTLVDSILIGTKLPFFVDAILQPVVRFTLDAITFLQFTVEEEEFFIDGSLKFVNQVAPMRIDSILTEGNNVLPFVNAILKAENILAPWGINALVQAEAQEEEFFVSAVLFAEQEEEFFVDANFAFLDQEETFLITASLAVTQPPVDFTVDGLMLLPNNRFRIDLLLQTTRQEVPQIDAILAGEEQETFFIDSKVKAFDINEEFFVNAKVVERNITEFFVDAVFPELTPEVSLVDAIVKQFNINKVFTMDAELVKLGAFLVDVLPLAQGDGVIGKGNNGSTNPFAVNPFINQLDGGSLLGLPLGTLVGQRLRLSTAPIRVIRYTFKMARAGTAGTPTGTLTGRVYKNSIAGTSISPSDLIVTSDNVINVADLPISPTTTDVTFIYDASASPPEITEDDNIFLGFDISGANEATFIETELTGLVIDGGDANVETVAGIWGADLGIDLTMTTVIDDEPRQRGSALVSAVIGIIQKEFTLDARVKSLFTIIQPTIDAKVVVPIAETFTIGARLIKEIDYTISAFVGEVQETVLDVESVIVENNSDEGVESSIGGGT